MQIFMRTGSSSLVTYKTIASDIRFGNTTPTVKDISSLLEVMKAELIIDSYSPLLDAAYNECANYCASRRITILKVDTAIRFLSEPNRRHVLPPYDAWWLPIFLAEHLRNGLTYEIIEDSLPYFWGNSDPGRTDHRQLLQAFQSIDRSVVELRREMYMGSAKENADNRRTTADEAVVAERVEQEVGDRVQRLIGEAEDKKNAIIAQAQSEAVSIVDSARQQAAAIIDSASLRAEKTVAEGKKRVRGLFADGKLLEFKTDMHNTEQRFSEVREALVKANESIKLLEDSVSEGATRKACAQLIELYNLISDTKDSTYSLALQIKSQDVENAAYNMDVFLDILVEYLADYGIQTLASTQGERFSAKNQAAEKPGAQFDPRNSYIVRSLRNGFAWGEQVLQKERVEIEGDRHVSWH